MSGKTTVFSSALGDIALPITESTVDGALGTNTPAPATVTTLAVQNAGTFTLNGATPVTVANANVTATSQILITLKTVGGTVGAQPHVETITPGTGFTVEGTASDTSVYNYAIIN